MDTVVDVLQLKIDWLRICLWAPFRAGKELPGVVSLDTCLPKTVEYPIVDWPLWPCGLERLHCALQAVMPYRHCGRRRWRSKGWRILAERLNWLWGIWINVDNVTISLSCTPPSVSCLLRGGTSVLLELCCHLVYKIVQRVRPCPEASFFGPHYHCILWRINSSKPLMEVT